MDITQDIIEVTDRVPCDLAIISRCIKAETSAQAARWFNGIGLFTD